MILDYFTLFPAYSVTSGFIWMLIIDVYNGKVRIMAGGIVLSNK